MKEKDRNYIGEKEILFPYTSLSSCSKFSYIIESEILNETLKLCGIA